MFFTIGLRRKKWRKEIMESTFDKFIKSNPKRKAKFDKEYNEFLLSEFVLEKMESENISVRKLAKKAGVSPTIIQKIRSKNAERINFRTFTNVLHTLGYKINIEKI
jgi:DNA-binding Xre family transcriptional regulator